METKRFINIQSRNPVQRNKTVLCLNIFVLFSDIDFLAIYIFIYKSGLRHKTWPNMYNRHKLYLGFKHDLIYKLGLSHKPGFRYKFGLRCLNLR